MNSIRLILVFFCLIVLTWKAQGQIVYFATDTLVLEVGSGWDLGPHGKNGIWEYPFDNNPRNKVKFRATFKNDTLNGPFEAFWKSGKKKIEANFDMGSKTGEALYYFPEGSLKYRLNYKRDTLDGMVTLYFPSGKRMIEWNFRNGVLNGICRAYNNDRENTLHAEGEFLNGLRHGTYVDYVGKNGKIVEQFEKGYPLSGQKVFASDELITEFVLDKKIWEYTEVISYEKGKKVKQAPLTGSLRKHFLYGTYLFLPENFR